MSSANTPSDQYYKLPLVSIIVVNYNYAAFLEQAVRSALNQSYPFVECIIVDDCSTDASGGVLDELEARHRDLQIHRRKINGGQSAATLDGLALSKGDYILFLDSDDFLLEDCISTHILAHLSLRMPVGFTSGDMLQVWNNHVISNTCINTSLALLDERIVAAPSRDLKPGPAAALLNRVDRKVLDRLYAICPWYKGWFWSATSAIVYRRDALAIWAAAPGLAGLRYSTDAFFCYGIHAMTGSVLIDEPVAAYRTHGSNVFAKGPPLAHVRNFSALSIGHREDHARNLIIDFMTSRPEHFDALLWTHDRFKTIAEQLDGPNINPMAPAWAGGSRLSEKLVHHFDAMAKVFGRGPLLQWMIARGIPAKAIRQAGIDLRLEDLLVSMLPAPAQRPGSEAQKPLWLRYILFVLGLFNPALPKPSKKPEFSGE